MRIAEITDVFGIWPSLVKMAEETGHEYDRVRKWRKRGRIPEHAWDDVISAAARRETLITVQQLRNANEPTGWHQ